MGGEGGCEGGWNSYLLHFAYCKMCSVFREFLGVINDTYLLNQCRVKSAEFLISTFSFSKIIIIIILFILQKLTSLI